MRIGVGIVITALLVAVLPHSRGKIRHLVPQGTGDSDKKPRELGKVSYFYISSLIISCPIYIIDFKSSSFPS